MRARTHEQAPTIVVVALMFVTLVSRLWQARESLWLDELHTAWAAGGPLASVAGRAIDGNHSPLFFWLEWLVTQVFGNNELALRLPSIAASTALVYALFHVARRWTGSAWIALLPAWLAAVDPQSIYFGTEARPYALIQLLSVLHVAVFFETVTNPTRTKRLLLIGSAALLFHLHYTLALLLFVESVSFVVIRAGFRSHVAYTWRDFGIDAAVIFSLCLPAVTIIRAVYARRTNWNTFIQQRPIWEGLLMVPWAWTSLLLAAVSGATRRWRTKDPARPPEQTAFVAALIAGLLTVPVVLAWLATTADVARLLHPRYLAATAPLALLLIALAVRLVPVREARVLAAVGIAVFALFASDIPGTIAARRQLISYRQDDWRGAISAFNHELGHDRDPVLVRTLLIESDELRRSNNSTLRAYCLYPVTSLYRIDAADERLVPLPRSDSWRLQDADHARLAAGRGFWMIVQGSASSTDDIQTRLLSALNATVTGWTTTTRSQFGTVRMVRFDRAG